MVFVGEGPAKTIFEFVEEQPSQNGMCQSMRKQKGKKQNIKHVSSLGGQDRYKNQGTIPYRKCPFQNILIG